MRGLEWLLENPEGIVVYVLMARDHGHCINKCRFRVLGSRIAHNCNPLKERGEVRNIDLGREVGRNDSCYFCLYLGGRGRFRPPPQRTPPPLEVQGYASSSVQLAAALVARACVD